MKHRHERLPPPEVRKAVRGVLEDAATRIGEADMAVRLKDLVRLACERISHDVRYCIRRRIPEENMQRRIAGEVEAFHDMATRTAKEANFLFGKEALPVTVVDDVRAALLEIDYITPERNRLAQSPRSASR